MFGKPVREYVEFQVPFLVALVTVGLARLLLSLGGVPNGTLRWLAMNAVLWTATVAFGVAAQRSGFGTYRHLLPLVAIQLAAFHGIAVLGILLAIAGQANVFAAPEYSISGGNQWVHLVAHLTVGMVVPGVLLWGVASLAMLATRRLSPAPAPAARALQP